MPAATWLTQVMATQKVVEAVWRQGVLTAGMLSPSRSPEFAAWPGAVAGHPSSGSRPHRGDFPV